MSKSCRQFVGEITRSKAGGMRYSQRLQFWHGALTIRSNSPSALAALRARFVHYLEKDRQPAGAATRVEIVLVKKMEFPVPECRRAAGSGDLFSHFREGGTEFLQQGNRLLVGFSETPGLPWIIVVNRPGRAGKTAPKKKEAGKVPLKGGVDFVNWDEIADLVFLLFARSNGWICLHAACLSHRGRGVILAGASGSGKTTAALSLLRGGFAFHSDEVTVIQATATDPLQTSGLLLCPRIRARVSSLNDLEKSIDNAFAASSMPHQLPAPVVASGVNRAVQPGAIFVIEAQAVRKRQHRVQALDEQSALVALMGQVLDPTRHSRQRQVFDALSRLVSHCRLFRLHAGSDIASLPAFIKRVAFREKKGARNAR